MSRLRGRRLLSLVAVPLVLAGCTSGQDTASDEPAEVGTPNSDGVLALMGTDNLQWQPEALEAPAGEITFELQCGELVNHNLAVDVGAQGADGEERTLVAECSPGASAQGTLTLEAGEYPFVCTVPGHESSMQGLLTVS